MRRFSRDPVVDKSLRHSIRDGVAYAVMTGAGEAYFSAYAVFLNMSVAMIGWLAALPPLLGSFAQLVSAAWGHRINRRKRIILTGAGLQALTWLPIIALPLLFPAYAGIILMLGVVFYFAAANLAIPQWVSLMGELVPERRRGRYFALRTRQGSIASFVALIGAGLLLHGFTAQGETAAGFVTVFVIALIGRIISVYHLGRMYDPPGHVAVLDVAEVRSGWSGFRAAPVFRFSVFFALMQFATAIASPFFTVYMLRDLQWTYLEFTINTGAVVLVQFFTLNFFGRLSDAFGNRLILATTGWVIPWLPAMWLFSTDYVYLLVIQLLGGLAWAGFNLSAGNFLYDLIPSRQRVGFLAIHNVMSSIGVFAGAILGGFLAMHLPTSITLGETTFTWLSALYGVFALSTLARLTVAAIFLPRLKEVRVVRRMSVGGLIFRVARFNVLSGLFFDIIGSKRAPK